MQTAAARVLIVDDDADSCDILSHLLHHFGYAPVCVQDSTEGLQHLLGEPYALGLIDLVMPGLNGFDLLRVSRAGTPNAETPLIAVSSHHELRYKAVELGFRAFIEKPVELAKLRPILEGLLPAP